jgi:uncharacterized protein YndB with AHSA1/START domain
MVDILHRVGVAATPQSVYQALSTVEGVAAWWSAETTLDDGVLRVRFGDAPGFDIAVVTDRPDEQVEWAVLDGPPEWRGTTIHFDLSLADGLTIVLLKHADWREAVEYMYDCSTQWAIFLMSLKSLVETGKGQPYPRGVRINNLR